MICSHVSEYMNWSTFILELVPKLPSNTQSGQAGGCWISGGLDTVDELVLVVHTLQKKSSSCDQSHFLSFTVHRVLQSSPSQYCKK